MREITLHDRLSFNYPWTTLSDDPQAFRAAVREFLDNGVRRFVIDHIFTEQLIRSREKVDLLRKVCKEMEVEFCSVHGMFGDDYDLDIPVLQRRRKLGRQTAGASGRLFHPAADRHFPLSGLLTGTCGPPLRILKRRIANKSWRD